MATFDRRTFMVHLSALGVSATFADAVWAGVQDQERVTPAILRDAEVVAGLEFTPEERAMMVRGLNEHLEAYEAIRQVPLANAVAPAVHFDPRLPHMALPGAGGEDDGPVSRRFDAIRVAGQGTIGRPARLEEVAFWPVSRLSELIRTGQVTSVEVTEMYLSRLRRHGPTLEAVITLTDDLAMRQARRADAELLCRSGSL